MLEIFKDYPLATSILDDFDFYEDKQKSLHATSSHHVTYAHQVEFDEDVYEMEFNEDDSTMVCMLIFTLNYMEMLLHMLGHVWHYCRQSNELLCFAFFYC